MSYFLDEQLKNVKSVGINGHVRPDGDCVGSVLSVYNYIRDNYPDVEVNAYLQEIPGSLKFLKNSEKLLWEAEDKELDLFIVLDCSEVKRLGDAERYFNAAKRTLCIDHHLSNGDFADVNRIVSDASSTCELIYEAMDPSKVTKEIAECIYTGMVTDTGVFQYDCTKKRTMEIAGILMDKGIDYSYIVEHAFFEKTFEQNRIMGKALLKATLHDDGRIISSFITKEEEEEIGCRPSDYDGIAEQLRNTVGVVSSIFLHETEPGEFRGSTRTSGNVNLAEVAGHFGGGGHAKAAGFNASGNPEEIIEEVIRIIKDIEKRDN